MAHGRDGLLERLKVHWGHDDMFCVRCGRLRTQFPRLTRLFWWRPRLILPDCDGPVPPQIWLFE